MRHRMANRKLGRTSSHRAAMFRNQLASIIEKERIVTTLIKAKELRPLIEKMVTLGRTDDLHSRRQAARSLSDNEVVQKLFTNIAPRFTDRPGGYTRIVKLGPRRGDGAEMAILEFVDYTLATSEAPAAGEKTAKKSAPAKAVKPAAKKAAAKKATAKKAAPAAEEKPKKLAKSPDEEDTLIQKPKTQKKPTAKKTQKKKEKGK